MFDVAVIGAGVVGGMIARTLSAYDLKICIRIFFQRIRDLTV